MATNTEIPTQGGRPFNERVELLGVTYTLHFQWNKRAACWVLDIYDSTDQLKALCGIPLVTGADLLEQFLYIDLGRHAFMTAMTIGPGAPPDQVPTFWNLGTDSHLYLTSP